MIRLATPVLRTANYPDAHNYYTNALGFTCVEEAGEPANFGIFKRDKAQVFVIGHHGGDTAYHHWRAYFHVADIDHCSRNSVNRERLSRRIYGVRFMK